MTLARLLQLASMVLLAACGGGGGSSFTPSPGIGIAVERAFPNLVFARPVGLVQAPADATRWFVIEQEGVVRVFDDDPGAAASSVVIDIQPDVVCCGERGLLGIAFPPGSDGRDGLVLSYTGGPPLVSRLVRFVSADDGDTWTAVTGGSLEVPQPFDNHNGGHIVYGPDGYLYVGFGDGGSSNDPDDNGQDPATLLGKILRIDFSPLSAAAYQPAAGNPFFGNPLCELGSGLAGCPEVFALGFRNPWRFSFDRSTGDLWVADVGQGDFEEAGIVEVGKNYGWRDREGAHCNPNLYPADNCSTVGLTDPLTEYGLTGSQSVTGGFVYRGSAIPALRGTYVFADFISGQIFGFTPGANGTRDPVELLDTALSISSFAEDEDGELLIIDYAGGTLHRIVPAP